ncbi:MAG: DUF2442 domain-containing protein [Bacteroidota bacterium]
MLTLELTHEVEQVRFVGDEMKMVVDGKQYGFSLSAISTRLANASQLERETFEISPSGYGIHWTLLDEDLSIDGLLGITHTPQRIKERVATS